MKEISDDISISILIAQVVLASYLLGLVGVIQFIVYPIFELLDSESFRDVHELHVHRITWIVATPMVGELIISCVLLTNPPAAVSSWLIWAGMMLTVIIWLSTAVLQLPLHRRLRRRLMPDLSRRLTYSNWIRTIAWFSRVVVSVWMLVLVLAA